MMYRLYRHGQVNSLGSLPFYFSIIRLTDEPCASDSARTSTSSIQVRAKSMVLHWRAFPAIILKGLQNILSSLPPARHVPYTSGNM